MKINELPGHQEPFMLEAGEGQRYIFGAHLATVIARKQDMGTDMAGAILTGAKGAVFPLHRHAVTHEAFYVVEGTIELTLGDKQYLLCPGDYVSVPPGTPHGFSYLDHRGKMVAWTFIGDANLVYAAVGKPYAGTVYPELPADADWSALNASVDTELLNGPTGGGNGYATKSRMAPDNVTPFVLAGSEGERMLAADQLFTINGSQKSSHGLFLSLLTEGPAGREIPRHLHQHVTETFYCLHGAMKMFVGGDYVTLSPGDFLHVPPGTPHSYQLLKNDTRFVGFLTPGYFEDFFRLLCEPYESYIYPLVPWPFRFDRVMQHMSELDLTVLERPGGAPPQAGV